VPTSSNGFSVLYMHLKPWLLVPLRPSRAKACFQLLYKPLSGGQFKYRRAQTVFGVYILV